VIVGDRGCSATAGPVHALRRGDRRPRRLASTGPRSKRMPRVDVLHERDHRGSARPSPTATADLRPQPRPVHGSAYGISHLDHDPLRSCPCSTPTPGAALRRWMMAPISSCRRMLAAGAPPCAHDRRADADVHGSGRDDLPRPHCSGESSPSTSAACASACVARAPVAGQPDRGHARRSRRPDPPGWHDGDLPVGRPGPPARGTPHRGVVRGAPRAVARCRVCSCASSTSTGRDALGRRRRR
jgi:hypothetical protein